MSDRYSIGAKRTFDLLLIESEPDDIRPFIDSFTATDLTNEVHVVSDGEEALDYVHQRGDHETAPRADLILLDLHISGDTGDEILRELKNQPKFRPVPVLVFTTSESVEDIAKSYQLNANAHLQKPTDARGFEVLAQAIEDFWLRVAHIPPK